MESCSAVRFTMFSVTKHSFSVVSRICTTGDLLTHISSIAQKIDAHNKQRLRQIHPPMPRWTSFQLHHCLRLQSTNDRLSSFEVDHCSQRGWRSDSHEQWHSLSLLVHTLANLPLGGLLVESSTRTLDKACFLFASPHLYTSRSFVSTVTQSESDPKSSCAFTVMSYTAFTHPTVSVAPQSKSTLPRARFSQLNSSAIVSLISSEP